MSDEDGQDRPTVTDGNGVTWEVFDYGEGDVLYQRRCPDCDGGLRLAPVRFHARCGGSGYLVTRVMFGSDARGSEVPR